MADQVRRSAAHRDLRSRQWARPATIGGDASCVEKADEQQGYAWRRYRRERERRGALRGLYQDRDQKTVAGVERTSRTVIIGSPMGCCGDNSDASPTMSVTV